MKKNNLISIIIFGTIIFIVLSQNSITNSSKQNTKREAQLAAQKAKESLKRRNQFPKLKKNLDSITLKNINKAIKLAPQNHSFYEIKADLFIEQKKFNEAKLLYQKALSMYKTNPKSKNNTYIKEYQETKLKTLKLKLQNCLKQIDK